MVEMPWYQEGPADRHWPAGREPSRATPIGDGAAEPLGIYLGSHAVRAIERSLEQDPERPLGGLLVGFPLAGARRPFLAVTDLILLPPSAVDESDVRFTPAVFGEILPAWEERQDGAVIAGWCHAAPGRGIALSNFHRFNHHRHFPRPWQIVLVIDTARQASLVYRWEKGQLVPVEGFYYWDMEGEPAADLFEPPVLSVGREEPAAAPGERASPPGRARRWIWPLAAALLIYLLIPQAPGSIPWMRQRLSPGYPLAEPASGTRPGFLEPSPPSAAESTAAGTPAQLPAAPQQAGAGEDPREPGPPATEATGAGATPSGGPEALAGEPRGPAAVREYVIQPGDTMWAISRTLLGDPRLFRELAQKNQIENPDRIFPGQRLVVPLE